MRVLLVQPPFLTTLSPSLGLSSLRAALLREGVDARIRYCNLEFAASVGMDLYESVQSDAPVELLFGDLVFGPALQDSSFDADRVEAFFRSFSQRKPRPRSIPADLLSSYGKLVHAACRFTEKLAEENSWYDYDLIGFTTTFNLVPALALGRSLKRNAHFPPIVMGGGHCDGGMGLQLMRSFPWIDYVARGEGERLVIELARSLQRETGALSEIEGLVWREGDRVCSAFSPVARIADMDSLPEPGYDDWLAQRASLGSLASGDLRLPFEMSRGCWYGQRTPCVFCGLNGSDLTFRSKSSSRALKDYRSLLDYGIPVVNAVDNVLDPRLVHELMPEMKAHSKKVTMFLEVRPTLPREQLIELRDAGVRVLQPGVESLSSRLLRLMNKGTSALVNIRLLRWVAELGLPVSWNLLYGLPGEEAADYQEMAQIIPSLCHLIPPVTGCNPVHVDRFSPLFETHRPRIRPIVPFAYATGLDADAIEELAYHFEFTEAHSAFEDLTRSIEDLRSVVDDWQRQVGCAAFVKVEREGRCWLYDTRPGAFSGEVLLSDCEHAVYKMMSTGVTRDALGNGSNLAPGELDSTLKRIHERRWAMNIDGRWLALAVSMDEDIPDEVPTNLQGSVATALYQHRMRLMWQSVARKAEEVS